MEWRLVVGNTYLPTFMLVHCKCNSQYIHLQSVGSLQSAIPNSTAHILLKSSTVHPNIKQSFSLGLHISAQKLHFCTSAIYENQLSHLHDRTSKSSAHQTTYENKSMDPTTRPQGMIYFRREKADFCSRVDGEEIARSIPTQISHNAGPKLL